MSGELFTLDTNILIYSIDSNADLRRSTAIEVIRRARLGPCHLMLQAVSEFYAAVTRKGILPQPEAARITEAYLVLFRTVAASATAVRTALATAAAGKASYWDALLIATAAEAGCSAILTEDLADGAELLGVRVINPFGAGGLAPEAEALLALD
jgi:predicted nucleic acid-binding protein